jgi:hypothetical protein
MKVCDPMLGVGFGEVMALEALLNAAKEEASEPPEDLS